MATPPSGHFQLLIQRHRRLGVATSCAIHAGLLAAALAILYIRGFGDADAQRPMLVVTLADGAHQAEPREASPEVQVAESPEVISDDVVAERISDAVEQAQQLDDDQKVDRLTVLAERLEDVSSQQSIDELAGAFQQWLGTSSRASEPAAEPPPGDFDFDTAQLHDVRRMEPDDGGVRYLIVMLDAAGRTVEIEVSREEGETAYQTMQRLKSFPLAEKLYRQITMPLLDKLIQTGRTAAQADVPTEPTN